MIRGFSVCTRRAGYRIKELLAPEGRVWKTASSIDWKERNMNACGVKKKMGRTWDFPLSLTTVADFYLCWQRGMWGSLYLAFNWLSICQHFTQFPVFKFPWRCGNIDSFQIVYLKASSPARPSSSVYTRTLNQYLNIDNSSGSVIGHLMYNLWETVCDRASSS